MPDSRFTHIFLDADETVLDFIASERASLRKTAELFNIKIDDNDVEVYSAINLSFWKQLEEGDVTREELKVLRFKKWFEYLCVNHIDPVAFGLVYEDNISDTSFLLDGAEYFVEKLSRLASVYIVTNGPAKCQHGRIDNSPIRKYIEGLFISEEVGFSKPDKRFFDKILEALGVTDKTKVIIIGDSLSSDMQGGRNADIATCLYCPSANIKSNPLCDFIITDYDHFFEIL